MLLLDDILLLPIRGVLWCAREIQQAAAAARAAERESHRDQLTALYLRLEAGQLSEAEFDQAEKQLLEQLDRAEDACARASTD